MSGNYLISWKNLRQLRLLAMDNKIFPEKSEFLFYTTEDGKTRVEVRLLDDTVWLTQKIIAELFQKDVRTINEHINNIFEEGELIPDSVIRKFRITAADGKNYDTAHYNLDAVKDIKRLENSRQKKIERNKDGGK
jgi:hypothetical protein